MPHCDTPSEGLRLSSSAQIHAGLLRAQIATGAELEISAPAAVLSTLVPLCDGTRSFGQIQSALEARLSWPKTTEFLHALVNQGVLRGAPPGRRMTSPLSAPSTALVADVRPMHDELPAAVTQAGFKLACATFASPSLDRIKGFGRAMSDEVAADIARSEAAERHAYFRPAQTARVGTAREIGNCVDPRTCVQYSRAQYQCPTLGVHRYDPAAEHCWIPARTLNSNERRWCHAELVYSANALNGGRAPSALTWQTTSGCASDVDFSRAVERAGLEVIERDAFVRHWLAQEPAVSIRLATLPDDCLRMVRYGQSRGFDLDVGILRGVGGPAVITACTSERQGLSVVSTACANDFAAAIEHSLAESLITTLTRASLPPRGGHLRPEGCRRPVEHGDLYTHKRHYARAHAITRGPSELAFDDARALWPASLADRLRAAQIHDAVSIDMTPTDAPLSRFGERIRTARVVIPGAIPLTYGFDALPRGMGVAAKRRGRFPHPLP